MKYRLLYIVLFSSITISAKDWWPLPMDNPDSGRDTLNYHVSLSATAGSGQYNAFWMQSNQGACASISPYSGALQLNITKPATRHSRWFDYSCAVDIYGMVHSPLNANPQLSKLTHFPVAQWNTATAIVHKCYAHARLYIFDIAAGIMPVADDMNTPLSTGSLLLSYNAASMPALRIGIDRWTAIPGLFGYAEIKGGVLHAWLNDNAYINQCKLHYKHIGIRLGGTLPINISYEFHHAAQWGGFSPNGADLGNKGKDFMNIFFAKSGGDSYNEKYNAQGNHLGSQQLAITAQGKQWRIHAYWQNLLEDNFAFLGKGNNLSDGRWGLTCTQSKWPYIHSLTLEYIGTTDQSGPCHDQDGIIYAGEDNYYLNTIYQQGWNYYMRSLGTPLITSPIYNQDGYTQTKNNRIKAWHIGLAGDIYGFQYKLLGTYIQNYGRYLDKTNWYDMQSQNIALLLDLHKTVKQAWGLQFGIRLAADIGTQWGNQMSAMLTIAKQGILTTL